MSIRNKPPYPFAFVFRTSSTLAYTNFKLRNERSYLGILWYLLEPLFVFCVLMMIRNTLNITTPYYPLYLFLGLIMFNFFAGATNHASKAIIENAEFIKWLKLRFEIFPIANTIQFTFSHIFELGILVFLFLFLGHFSVYLLWYLPVLVLLFMFTAGTSLILSALSVFTTDLANAWRILISRLLWLGTPIFYTLEEGSLLHTINLFNPLFHYIDMARSLIIFHKAPQKITIYLTIFFSVFIFTFGIWLFARQRNTIPEKI